MLGATPLQRYDRFAYEETTPRSILAIQNEKVLFHDNIYFHFKLFKTL